MSDEQETWTMSDDARASNPGGIKLNYLRWWRHYPLWPTLFAAGLIIGGWYLLSGSFLAVLFLVVLAFGATFYWKRVGEHFAYGCINPGIVVATEPVLVAVMTDLTQGVGEYPTVKIIKVPLQTIRGQDARKGLRLATVAVYSPGTDPSLRHWVDFDPKPVEAATGDTEQNKRAFKSIDSADWDELKAAVQDLPRPFELGLYPIGWSGKKLAK